MSWGTEQYGVDAWGAGASFTVLDAFVISTHEVVVHLSMPPLDRSPFLAGDANNVRSWRIIDATTTEDIRIASVARYSGATQWLLTTLDRLPDSLHVATVNIVGLLAANGFTPLFNLASFDFFGVTEQAIATPTARSDTRQVGSRDIANAPAPSLGDTTSVGGTYVIKGGDYALVSGAELVRKLVIRRLVSAPGDFFHLPRYGVGLKVKQPIPAGDLVKLKALIERQVKLEPDIAAVSASITQTNNVLTVVVRAKLARTGQQVTVAINSPIGQN